MVDPGLGRSLLNFMFRRSPQPPTPTPTGTHHADSVPDKFYPGHYQWGMVGHHPHK